MDAGDGSDGKVVDGGGGWSKERDGDCWSEGRGGRSGRPLMLVAGGPVPKKTGQEAGRWNAAKEPKHAFVGSVVSTCFVALGRLVLKCWFGRSACDGSCPPASQPPDVSVRPLRRYRAGTRGRHG